MSIDQKNDLEKLSHTELVARCRSLEKMQKAFSTIDEVNLQRFMHLLQGLLRIHEVVNSKKWFQQRKIRDIVEDTLSPFRD